MQVDKLIEKLEKVGELDVVGVMVYTTHGEDYRKVDYFNNILNLDITTTNCSTHKELLEIFGCCHIAFTTYELENFTKMASGYTTNVVDYMETTYEYLLTDEVLDVVFYQVTPIG